MKSLNKSLDKHSRNKLPLFLSKNSHHHNSVLGTNVPYNVYEKDAIKSDLYETGLQDQEENQVFKDLKDSQVNQDKPEPLVYLVLRDQEEKQDYLVLVDLKGQLDHEENQELTAHLDPQVREVNLVNLVHLVNLELQASVVNLEQEENQGFVVKEASLEHQEDKEKEVNQGLQVLLDPLDHVVSLVLEESLEQQEPLDREESLDCKDLLDLLVKEVNLDNLVSKVNLDHEEKLVCLDLLDNVDSLDLREPQDLVEKQVIFKLKTLCGPEPF